MGVRFRVSDDRVIASEGKRSDGY